MLDLQSLLQPVTADSPGGAKLDYRQDYLELERAVAGTPERQMGDTILAAEPPDWNAVEKRAVALLKESKDLRVAVHLVRALLQTTGFEGFAQGIGLVRQMVGTHWEFLHPELDAEDNDDPTARITAMMGLVGHDMNHAVRLAPLVKSQSFGSVSLRDLESTGQGDATSGAAASFEAVFQEVAFEDLSAATMAVEQSSNSATELASAWAARLPSSGPDFTGLRKVLAQASNVLKSRLAKRRSAESDDAAPSDGGGESSSPEAGPRGPVRTRDDVVRALDGICAYYARNEPSSPVPLLLERCKRLAAMSFLEIVKDMVPDGLTTIQTIAGKQDAGT
jgi:type VI secretion system protein ImpA